jgi:hypothetical protein
MKLKNTFGKYAWKVLMLMALLYANKGLQAQVEGQYDTISIGMIDTSLANGFVSHYETVDITRLNEMVINLNTILEIPELLIGKKYTVTVNYTNEFNYDLVVNNGIAKPTASCGCLNISYPNTVLAAGAELVMTVDIIPLVPGDKNAIIEFPIIKKSLVDGNPPTIVGIKPIKMNFKVKE